MECREKTECVQTKTQAYAIPFCALFYSLILTIKCLSISLFTKCSKNPKVHSWGRGCPHPREPPGSYDYTLQSPSMRGQGESLGQ